MSVETWAAEEAARTGSIPAFYNALEAWGGSFFGVGYVDHLAGTAVSGWAVFRTGFLVPWVGWVAIGWSLFWLLGSLIGVGAPAIPLIMPAVIGVVLLSGRDFLSHPMKALKMIVEFEWLRQRIGFPSVKVIVGTGVGYASPVSE